MLNQHMSTNEIAVLTTLHRRKEHNESPIGEIAEIATVTGISSSEEVQRALYILEGKSLVTPEPRGDLTSSQWQITTVGEKALDVISSV